MNGKFKLILCCFGILIFIGTLVLLYSCRPSVSKSPKTFIYTLPDVVNPIPADSQSLNSENLKTLSVPTTGDDYASHSTIVKLTDPAIDMVNSLNGFLETLRQTRYSDNTLIDSGAYKAYVYSSFQGSTAPLLMTIKSSRVTHAGRDAIEVDFWFILDEGTFTTAFENQPITGKVYIYSSPTVEYPFGEFIMNFDFDYGAGYGFATFETSITNGKNILKLVNSEIAYDDYWSNGNNYEARNLNGHNSDPANKEDKTTYFQAELSANGDVAGKSQKINNGNNACDNCGTTVFQVTGNLVRIWDTPDGQGETISCKDKTDVKTYYDTYSVFDSTGTDVKKSIDFSSTYLGFEKPTALDVYDVTGASSTKDFSGNAFFRFYGYTLNVENASATDITNYYFLAAEGDIADLLNIPDGTELTGLDTNTYYVRPASIIKTLEIAAGCTQEKPSITFDMPTYEPHGLDTVVPSWETVKTTNDAPTGPIKVFSGNLL